MTPARIAELRALCDAGAYYTGGADDAMTEALDEVERLRAEVEKSKALLARVSSLGEAGMRSGHEELLAEREAWATALGISTADAPADAGRDWFDGQARAVVTAAVLAEREACGALADEYAGGGHIAETIRARR